MEMMENRLARVSVAVRILGIATRALAAYADTYLLQGAGILGWRRRNYEGGVGKGPVADSLVVAGNGGVGNGSLLGRGVRRWT